MDKEKEAKYMSELKAERELFANSRCDCSYKRKGFLSASGCQVSKAPPANTACKCAYMGLWTCTGAVVSCADKNSDACKNPSLSKETCEQGKGDCQGY